MKVDEPLGHNTTSLQMENPALFVTVESSIHQNKLFFMFQIVFCGASSDKESQCTASNSSAADLAAGEAPGPSTKVTSRLEKRIRKLTPSTTKTKNN